MVTLLRTRNEPPCPLSCIAFHRLCPSLLVPRYLYFTPCLISIFFEFMRVSGLCLVLCCVVVSGQSGPMNCACEPCRVLICNCC